MDVPGTVPTMALEVIPWARQHVYEVARRYVAVTHLDDLWQETLAALVRACAYYDATKGPFPPYARTTIHRACWRYVVSREIGAQRAAGRSRERSAPRQPVPLDWLMAVLDRDDAQIRDDDLAALARSYLCVPSAESVALAREHAVHRIAASPRNSTHCDAALRPAVAAARRARAAG